MRLVKHIYGAKMDAIRSRGRLCANWLHDVRMVLSDRDMTSKQKRKCVQDIEKWRSIWNISIPIDKLGKALSDPPLSAFTLF